jgi:polyisoprenoid-binding protein YceI
MLQKMTINKWSIDPSHSEIAFRVRHLMIAHVKGSFKRFDANITTSGKDFTTAQIDLWIDSSSITTNDENRDRHLTSSDFLNAENHKQINFVSSTIGKPYANQNHELWGELTILGITKNVMLIVQFGGISSDPYNNEKAGFTVQGKIIRKDWGLIWDTPNALGNMVIGDEIEIIAEIELINTTNKEQMLELEIEEAPQQSMIL